MRMGTVLLVAAVLTAGFVVAGCEDQPAAQTGQKALASAPALCAKCGQIKGTDVCCQADAAVCAKCGLAKGSPGCCKIK
ncbi:MAG: hypothetical protein ACYS8K_08380 [Planctomycetota bacterium]